MFGSILRGLFIGASVAGLVFTILMITPITGWVAVAALYLYVVVGGLTAFIIHREVSKTLRTRNRRIPENIQELSKIRSTIGKKSVKANPLVVRFYPYEPAKTILDEIGTTNDLIRSRILLEKELERLTQENTNLIEFSVEKLSKRVLSFSSEV